MRKAVLFEGKKKKLESKRAVAICTRQKRKIEMSR